MIKRTLCFTNPAYLSLKDGQMVVRLPEVERSDMPDMLKKEAVRTIPIEDIGAVVLDNRQITITHGLLEALLENNCSVITCDSRGMPGGLMLPLCGNTVQSQTAVLAACAKAETGCMRRWEADVRSGDTDNLEGRAAAYYWKSLFAGVPGLQQFTRDRQGLPPNNLLNYGYAILRAVIARSLVSSGLLPTLGIHHHNRYNAYCLADDIMEPYRPYVDSLVYGITEERGGGVPADITKELKTLLLGIPVADVRIGGRRSPLMVAATQTTASLHKCFTGEARRIAYPEM